MPTKNELLTELQNLAAGTGPDITLFKFREATGIGRHHIYHQWGNWTNLRLAAGLPPRAAVPKVYSDEYLFQELSRAGEACAEFPTMSAFGRLSQRCWSTLERRFGQRSQVWNRYFDWLQQHDPANRPTYARDLTPDAPPAAIPGVTRHRSAKQVREDDHLQQLGLPSSDWQTALPLLAAQEDKTVDETVDDPAYFDADLQKHLRILEEWQRQFSDPQAGPLREARRQRRLAQGRPDDGRIGLFDFLTLLTAITLTIANLAQP